MWYNISCILRDVSTEVIKACLTHKNRLNETILKCVLDRRSTHFSNKTIVFLQQLCVPHKHTFRANSCVTYGSFNLRNFSQVDIVGAFAQMDEFEIVHPQLLFFAK